MRSWSPLCVLLLVACSDYNLQREQDPVVGDDTDVSDPIDDITDTDPDTDSDTDEDPVIEGEPIADAGPDQVVSPLDWVVLDAGGSRDPNNLYPLKFAWTLVSRPADSQAVVIGKSELEPTFWADLAGDYVFELNVQNSAGIWDSTPDRVTVTAEPTDGFYVQVSWDTHSDQDLHLLNTGARLFDTPGDCSWCNMTPSWGAAGRGDDPSLDYDTITEFGPETTTITDPASGTYTVAVHYYGQDGDASCWGTCPRTTATVRLFLNSVEVKSWTGVLTDQGDVWTVATIEWPSMTVTTVDRMSYTSLIICN